MSAARQRNVLFLCTGNSARSILAEAICNRKGADRFRAWSAGSFPKGEVNPGAVRWLAANGFVPGDYRSKSWDEFAGHDAAPFDVIITVCDNAAGEVCPIWPGRPVTGHWGLSDPADVEGSLADIDRAFAGTARQLEARIAAFMRLPIEVMTPSELRQELNAIGSAGGEATSR